MGHLYYTLSNINKYSWTLDIVPQFYIPLWAKMSLIVFVQIRLSGAI